MKTERRGSQQITEMTKEEHRLDSLIGGEPEGFVSLL